MASDVIAGNLQKGYSEQPTKIVATRAGEFKNCSKLRNFNHAEKKVEGGRKIDKLFLAGGEKIIQAV